MKTLSYSKKYFVAAIILAVATSCQGLKRSSESEVDGWAILAEEDDYEPPHLDLPVDYIDIARMRQTLEKSGWNPEHIYDLREFDRETLQVGLDWLEESADENDIVVLYVTAHGDYLRDDLRWSDFFAAEWEQIPSHRRLLVVDACRAANFVDDVENDPGPHLSVAGVAGNEFSWKGLEEEGLPIIGGVFTYYFSDALANPDADANADGWVSVQEAAQMAEAQQRIYMHDVVLVVPEFVEMFHSVAFTAPERDPTYPNVTVDDAIGEPLFLALDAYQ